MILPLCITLYAYSFALEYSPGVRYPYYIMWAVAGIYFIILMFNVITGWVFRYDAVEGYVRGPLKNVTYLTMLFLFGCIEFSVIKHRKEIASRIFWAFVCLPALCGAIMAVQFVKPNIVLTGTASFAALLLSYLVIQSDQIEYDMVTGLMTYHKFETHICSPRENGTVYILEIDNIIPLQNSLRNKDFRDLQKNLAREMNKLFGRKVYHLSTGRFAAIGKNVDVVEKSHGIICDYIQGLYYNQNILLFPVVFYAVAKSLSKGEKDFAVISEQCNQLLSEAKKQNSVELYHYDKAFTDKIERDNQICNILKRELRADSTQFQVYFQPIYSLKEKKFTYMEALSRLIGTELGFISPGEFVRIAEERGLVEKLGITVFEKVCKFISENKDVVNAVSVNFSVYQMSNPKIVENVLNTINRYGIKPQNVIVEITESIFIDNLNIVNENMRRLSEAGVVFYLDDFGTGYSNLSNVVMLPFKTVKMDRSLVLTLEQGKKYIDLFTNLVSTFKDANLNILVEGVETEVQGAIVQDAGADYIQGFLYSKPMPPENCIELLQKQ